MKPSSDIIEFIKKTEALKLVAYKPLVNDRWTIGYGATYVNGTAVKEGDTITEEAASDVLTKDVNILAQRLSIPNIPDHVTQQQFDAVVSLAYNIGLTAFRTSQTGTMFYAGNNISARFPLWNESGGVVVQGLVTRRKQEQKIYNTGAYT